MASVGVIAEDNKRVRYLIEQLERKSLRVHLIDVDRKSNRIKSDLDYLIIVRDHINHSVIEKARAFSKYAQLRYLDRSSISEINKFCTEFTIKE